jgi:cellobiose phosphorylase
LEYKEEKEEKEKFIIIKNNLKKSLNTKGWDGLWYKRAITDEGEIIGSNQNKECKIDGIVQSWSVISEAGNNDKKYIAMESVKKYLVDEENQLIKLLTPAFTDETINPGYIRNYPVGVRENGGQYTHGSIWSIMAFAKLGFLEDSIRYLEMINPITHAETREKALRYKIEPYVLAGDVYSNKSMLGRGGWSWYTGASSWYYKVCLENILGLEKRGTKLFLPNKISKTWDYYEIQYRYKSNLYNIKVNLNQENPGKREIFINGEKIEKDYIELKNENKIENVEIKM